MKQTLIDIAKSLVEFPDEVVVNDKISGDVVVLELSVAQSDMGKVIGKHGRIARSLRLVMKTAGGRIGKRVNVEIKD